jgi:hypothetical protein
MIDLDIYNSDVQLDSNQDRTAFLDHKTTQLKHHKH